MIQKAYMQLRKLFIGANLLTAGFSGILEAEKCPLCGLDHPDNFLCTRKASAIFEVLFKCCQNSNKSILIESFKNLTVEDQNFILNVFADQVGKDLNPNNSPIENLNSLKDNKFANAEPGELTFIIFYMEIMTLLRNFLTILNQEDFEFFMSLMKEGNQESDTDRLLENASRKKPYLRIYFASLAGYLCVKGLYQKDISLLEFITKQLRVLRKACEQNPELKFWEIPFCKAYVDFIICRDEKTKSIQRLLATPIVFIEEEAKPAPEEIFTKDVLTEEIPTDLANIGDVSKFVLSHLSDSGKNFLLAQIWGALNDNHLRIDPTLSGEFWLILRNLLDPYGQVNPEEKEVFKKQILEFLLRNPKLCARIWSVFEAPLHNHFLPLIKTSKRIFDKNGVSVAINPSSVRFKDYGEENEKDILITINPNGTFHNGKEEILIDFLGSLYLEDETDYLLEGSTWTLEDNLDIIGKAYSNEPAAAAYLVTILCVRNLIENSGDLFVSSLEQLKLPEPAFSFFFTQSLHTFLACCQEIEDPILAGNFVDIFFKILRSDKFDPQISPNPINVLLNFQTEEELHFIEEILRLYVADPDFSNKQFQANIKQIPNLLKLCPKFAKGLLEKVFFEYLKENPELGFELLHFVSNVLSKGENYLSCIEKILASLDKSILYLYLLQFLAENTIEASYIEQTILPALHFPKINQNSTRLVQLEKFSSAFNGGKDGNNAYDEEDIVNLFHRPVQQIFEAAVENLCPHLYERSKKMGNPIETIIAELEKGKIHLRKDIKVACDDEIKIYENLNEILPDFEAFHHSNSKIFPFLAMIIIHAPDNAPAILYDILFKK